MRLLVEKVLDFSSPQRAISRCVHLIKDKLVLGQCNCQHTAIIELQTNTYSGRTNNRQKVCHYGTIVVKQLATTHYDLPQNRSYHVLKLIKGNVTTMVGIIVVKALTELCF